MSLTHFSSSSNLPETLWWSTMDSNFDHHKPPQSSTFNFNIHQESDQDSTTSTTTDQFPKQPMFEKPLTPSDVGKLNRLVIPKQHAEKYFPLNNGDSVVVPVAEQQKGFLLTFEDESGKLWRFRYSYWNSSQSYVLTKGWSRYVKEKRLESGDVVLFERHRFDSDRLFIGWRRRVNVPVQDSVNNVHHQYQQQQVNVPVQDSVNNGWTTARVFYDAQFNYPSHHLPISLHQPYQPDCLHAAGGVNNNDNVENNQRDMVGAASGNPRSVRLFGVNLECPDDYEPSTPDGSSHGAGQPHYQYYSNANNLNINFSQMRYNQHQG